MLLLLKTRASGASGSSRIRRSIASTCAPACADNEERRMTRTEDLDREFVWR